MFGVKLIKALGTPEAKQHMVEILSPAVLLAKSPDNIWRVADAREVEITRFEFESVEEVIGEFGGEIFAMDSDNCLLTKSADENAKGLLKNYWHHSKALEELNRDKNILTKFTYQLLSIEKLIPSLLEPFPVEVLLNILIDSLGEVFTAYAAAYSCMGNHKLKKVGSTGNNEFPDELEEFTRCYPGSVIEDNTYLVSSISEGDSEQYFIVFKRAEPFQEEEISILRTLTSLLQKSRYLISEQTKHREIESLVSQFEFILEILKNFSVRILSTFDGEELERNICDAIKEMFQAEFVMLYQKIELIDKFKLVYSVNLKNSDFDESIQYSGKIETGIMSLEIGFNFNKCFGIKTESGSEYLIFIGESVLENYYKREITGILDKIIPAEIERAFSNVTAVDRIKEQSEYIERIVKEMCYLSENLQEIERVKDKNALLEKLNLISANTSNFSFKDIRLYEDSKEQGGNKSFRVGDETSLLGSVEYTKDTTDDMKDNYILSFLSQIGLQTQEKINVFKPEQTVSSIENIVVDFLKVKYRLSGLMGNPSVYSLDKDNVDLNKLEGYGVGLKTSEALFFATYLSSDDLNSILI